MPGISGIISKDHPQKNHNQLQLMMDVMFHEKFYKYDIYNNEQMGIYVGWMCHEGNESFLPGGLSEIRYPRSILKRIRQFHRSSFSGRPAWQMELHKIGHDNKVMFSSMYIRNKILECPLSQKSEFFNAFDSRGVILHNFSFYLFNTFFHGDNE